MSSQSNINCAEAVDRMNKGLAWGLLLIAVTYGLEATGFMVSEQAKEILSKVSGVTTVLTVLATLWGMWPIIKLKIQKNISVGQEPESFFCNAMHTSFKNSWVATTLVIVILLSQANRLEGLELPLKFYLISLFGFTTLVASLSFLLLTRDDGGQE